MSMREDRSSHYTWGLDDIVVNDTDPVQSARTGVRAALGTAAHAMSDQEIDAVIAAAQGAARTDVDLNGISDSDLSAASDLDTELYWDLETEQDGSTDEYDDGTRLDSDELRIDRLAGNPYHARDGRFAPGPHKTSGFAGGATPWNRAFDSREHLKQIEEHRAAETLHRAASLKLKGQMDALKQRAQSATPAQRAPMQRRFDKLASAREQHRSAANGAKAARKQATEDMEHARAAHIAGRHQETAMRRETAAQRAQAQREAIGVVGQRIGVAPAAHEHAPAAGAVSPGHPSWRPTEADTHAGLRMAEHERETASAALRQRDAEREHAALAEKLGSGKAVPTYGGRQVVEHAQPKRTQAEWNLHDQLQREARSASDDRAEARNRTAGRELPQAAHAVALPHAQALNRARGFLRGLLGR